MAKVGCGFWQPSGIWASVSVPRFLPPQNNFTKWPHKPALQIRANVWTGAGSSKALGYKITCYCNPNKPSLCPPQPWDLAQEAAAPGGPGGSQRRAQRRRPGSSRSSPPDSSSH